MTTPSTPIGSGAAPADLTFVHPPRITPEKFEAVLRAANSPAAPHAAKLYQIPLEYGLDPAIALAFFGHESSFGKKGKAVQTLNWGNLRKGQGHALRTSGGWAWYDSWEDSLRDWCLLIKKKYVESWNRPTVRRALELYAPVNDNNKPSRYADAVMQMVAGWQV